MSPLEASYPTTADSECSNKAETREKDLKSNCIKMMMFLKDEINTSFKESQENTVKGNA